MKRKLIALLILGVCSGVQANSDIVWETLSGSRSSGDFGWDYSYDIGLSNDTVLVDLDIALTGEPVAQSLQDRWEFGIESMWSTDRFVAPILFNVDWVSDNADQTVTIHSGISGSTPGRTII